MSYTTPKYGLLVPSPATRLNQLGTQLQQMGVSIEEVLESFDYNGADPNLVLSQVASLTIQLDALDIRTQALRGTQSQREATPPLPGQTWKDTDGLNRLWSEGPDGAWRLHSGEVTATAAAWTWTRDPIYGRSVNLTLPTKLALTETVSIQFTEAVGVNVVSVGSITRNAQNTVAQVRFLQFFDSGTRGFRASWQVVKL